MQFFCLWKVILYCFFKSLWDGFSDWKQRTAVLHRYCCDVIVSRNNKIADNSRGGNYNRDVSISTNSSGTDNDGNTNNIITILLFFPTRQFRKTICRDWLSLGRWLYKIASFRVSTGRNSLGPGTHCNENPITYSQKRDCAASVRISTFLCLSDLYMRSVCLFCCSQIGRNAHRHRNEEMRTEAAQLLF